MTIYSLTSASCASIEPFPPLNTASTLQREFQKKGYSKTNLTDGKWVFVTPKIPNNLVKWEDVGRGTIEYAGRLEAIPSSVYMTEREIKTEIKSKLFDEGVLWNILGNNRAEEVEEIKITHMSAWMGYHVFCMEVNVSGGIECRNGGSINTETIKVALNLLPTTEKRPVFREYWEIGEKAAETGYVANPICISEDGRLFAQEWVGGIPISSISGKDWKEKKEKIISLICEAQGHLNQNGTVFFPLMDYEIMYLEENMNSKEEERRIVFLDITRLKSGTYSGEELYKMCQRSAIKNTAVKVEDFLKGVVKTYTSFEKFKDFISGWDTGINLKELWNKTRK